MMQVFLDILSSRWMDGDRVSRRGKERNFLEGGETKEKNEGRDVVQRPEADCFRKETARENRRWLAEDCETGNSDWAISQEIGGNEIGKRGDRPRSDASGTINVCPASASLSSFPFFFQEREGRRASRILAPVTGLVEKEGWNSNSTIRIHGSIECLIGLRWISEVCSVVVSRCARNGERERGNLDPRPPTSSSSNRSLRPITRIYELDFCPVSSDILSKSNGIH